MTTDSLALEELNAKSAGIGKWMLKIHGMQMVEYEYTRQSKVHKGQKLECLLLAQSGTYCHGVIKTQYNRTKNSGGGDPAAELETMMSKFQNGAVFTLTKVALAEAKAEFLGAPVKLCIDLRKTNCTAVLASLVQMPPAPAPSEELASILCLDSRQRVDLTALIIDMSVPRRETTPYGLKDIVDITVVDGSMTPGEPQQVSAKMSIFFETNVKGAALLKSMQETHMAKTPLAMYGLMCTPQGTAKCTLKTGQTFFWEVARGAYAKLIRLQSRANEMMQAPASSITSDWQPSRSARDFEAEPAVHSVCGWVAALIRPPAAGPDDNIQGVDTVFQINHCHVSIPGAGQTILTKDDARIWLPQVRLTDATGSLTVSMREKAALALSGLASRDDFVSAHATDNVSFPVLASVRVHLTRRKGADESNNLEGGAAEPAFLDAVLVEAEDQDIQIMPTSALLALQPVLKSLAGSEDDLKIARLQEISILPYIGMVVNGLKCELALVFAAATEKSEFQKFGNGYRLITKNVLDVGFGPMAMKPEDCRASATAKYDLVAICTEHNLTDYKMAPPRKAAAQYALLTISGVRESAADAEELGRKTFMVDRMQLIEGPDNVTACQKMLGKLARARSQFTFEGTKRDRSAWADQPETPISSAKKVRALSKSPTDASLPGGV